MSLFICGKCHAIENTACCTRNINTNPEMPNLHLMDMQGFGDTIKVIETLQERGITINQGVVSKRHVNMLCSECNTGIWHDEFEKTIANEDELALSKISEYSMITPFDHGSDNIVSDDENTRFGYRLPTEEELAKRAKGKKALGDICAFSSALGIGLPPSFNRIFNNRDKHDGQTDEEKSKALRKAEIKRQLKSLKKRNNPNEIGHVMVLREEYDTL